MTGALRRYWIQLSLVGTAVVWGATFVVVKDALESFGLYSFLAWRFGIAVVAFVVIFPRALRRMDGATVIAGSVTGTFLCIGYVLQSWGLTSTSASNAAFITGLFVVITPLMQAVILRRLPRVATVLGAVVALIGLWLLSGGAAGAWNAGDIRVLGCAVAYSAHIIAIGALGKDRDVLAFTLVQLLLTAIVCAAIAALTEPFSVPSAGSVWFALALTGILATAVAFAVQMYAQRYLSPARTALILVSEPAFGGLFGWLAGESLGLKGLSGAGLILFGMVVAELISAKGETAEKGVVETALEGPPVVLAEDPPARS